MSLATELQHLLDEMSRAYSTGDAAGCAALFTEDAQLHSPFGPPASGRAEIEELHRDWVSDGGSKGFAILDCGRDGALAWCLARFSEGDVTGDGTSLVVLEQREGTGWRIRCCCLYGDPA